ncbi:MAG: beta-propeller fold lactonase family protein [Planctomycetes bacterium]|nr:beta-propeller fold lactonase family protein [Planctomycetota bacterium]
MTMRRTTLVAVLCVPLAPAAALRAQDTEPPASAPAVASGPRLVVLNKAAATASVLDPATGEERARLPVGSGPHEAATAPDGRTVVVCDYGGRTPGRTLTVLDVRELRVLRTIPLELPPPAEGAEPSDDPRAFLRPHGIRFLPDGDRVVVTSETQRRLCVVDVRRGIVERALPTRAETSHMVDLAPNGSRAFVANIGSGSVSVLDLVRSEHLATIETGRGAEGIAVHPSRPELWVANRAADSLSVVDTERCEELAELPCGGFPIRVAFTPDGRLALVSCARDGTVEVWDVAERRRVKAIAMNEAPVGDAEGERLFAGTFGDSPVPVGILVRPDGSEAFVANTQADIVTVIDLAALRIVRRLRAGPEPDGMAWVPAAGS